MLLWKACLPVASMFLGDRAFPDRPPPSRGSEYRAAFVNPATHQAGFGIFLAQIPETLARAERKYGVPQELIVAVIGVETIYGQDAGTFFAP